MSNYLYKAERIKQIVLDAGGIIVGKTRFQKMACLLALVGLEDEFDFEYHHYGPFSDELASLTNTACLLNFINIEERAAQWGGKYSVFNADGESQLEGEHPRKQLLKIAAEANAIELELAVTAAFLASKGEQTPWEKTRELKPEKSVNDRIERSKFLYNRLRTIDTPQALPDV